MTILVLCLPFGNLKRLRVYDRKGSPCFLKQGQKYSKTLVSKAWLAMEKHSLVWLISIAAEVADGRVKNQPQTCLPCVYISGLYTQISTIPVHHDFTATTYLSILSFHVHMYNNAAMMPQSKHCIKLDDECSDQSPDLNPMDVVKWQIDHINTKLANLQKFCDAQSWHAEQKENFCSASWQYFLSFTSDHRLMKTTIMSTHLSAELRCNLWSAACSFSSHWDGWRTMICQNNCLMSFAVMLKELHRDTACWWPQPNRLTIIIMTVVSVINLF